MKVREITVPVRDLKEGFYENEATNQVVAWGGKLEVRPEYQREFVYDQQQSNAVINTVVHGFPLNSMYFVDRLDGTFEVLDGQQRIISICRFVTNSAISVKLPEYPDPRNFPNLYKEDQDKILDYQLKIYVCEGTDAEKQAWFETINIAGEKLEVQEIRNALYHGAWLTDAKSVFSRRNCAANRLYGKYFTGECIRQKYLETAFTWAADAEGITGRDAVSAYMQKHRYDDNANDLWSYVEDVFTWVQRVFGQYSKWMKGIRWGLLYNEHKDDMLDPAAIQKQVQTLMADPEVERRAGIYEYILTGEKKHLHLRQFDDEQRDIMYRRQGGKCAICGKHFDIKDMHGDHIKPWSKGGRTDLDNGQMLCVQCNLKKAASDATT